MQSCSGTVPEWQLTPAAPSPPEGCSPGIWAWEIYGSFAVSSERSEWDFFLSFPLIKMILVSELPPTVEAAQKPCVQLLNNNFPFS